MSEKKPIINNPGELIDFETRFILNPDIEEGEPIRLHPDLPFFLYARTVLMGSPFYLKHV